MFRTTNARWCVARFTKQYAWFLPLWKTLRMQLFAKAAFSLSLKRREVCLMNFPLFTGCATALITPFLPDGKLDEPALRRLLALQTAAKIDALVLLGTTGEPCTLSMD